MPRQRKVSRTYAVVSLSVKYFDSQTEELKEAEEHILDVSGKVDFADLVQATYNQVHGPNSRRVLSAKLIKEEEFLFSMPEQVFIQICREQGTINSKERSKKQ